MKFDTATLMANPAIRSALAAEAEIAESRAHLAAMAKQTADTYRFRPSPTGINVKPPVTGENPWMADGWNLSKQALLQNRDPATAARLRSEAGLDGLHVPTREDAARVQSSGAFVAARVAAAVKADTHPVPQRVETATPMAPPVPILPPVPVTNPMADLARRTLTAARIPVPAERLDALVDELGKVARIADDGSVMLHDEQGRPMIDWQATTATARVVDLTPEAFFHDLQRERPELFEPTTAPEPPAPAPFIPLHVRAAQAHAAGPEAVAALMAERYGATR